MNRKDHVLLGAALAVSATENWLSEHVDPETGYVLDNTFAVEGAAADAKAVGDALALKVDAADIDDTLATSGAPADAKATGDALALKMAFTDLDTTLATSGKPADAKAAGDAIAALKTQLGAQVGRNSLFDISKSHNRSDTKITRIDDSSFTVGTGDYGSIFFGADAKLTLAAGYYEISGTAHGRFFLSTTKSPGTAFVENTASTPKRFELTEAKECYFGFNIKQNEVPAEAFTITPYVYGPAIPDIYGEIDRLQLKTSLNHTGKVYFGVVPTNWYTGKNSDYTADGFDADTTTAEIIAKFDTLVDSGYVTKKDLGAASDGESHIYEYDFVPTAASIAGSVTKKRDLPVILITGGIHGFEKASIFGLYYFLRDLVNEEDPALDYLRTHVILKVIPCCNPYGIDNKSYYNANGVNINRNFDTPGFTAGGTASTPSYGGETANSEEETQIICDFIAANPGALLYSDFHTNGSVSVSEFPKINWLDIAPISDPLLVELRYMACAHVERLTGQFIGDYELTVPYGTLCGRVSSGADGYTADFPSADVWACENGVPGHTIEGFTGFPDDTAYSGDALKGNSEIIGNWVLEVLCGMARLAN